MRYFTEKDIDLERRKVYRIYQDRTGRARAFNGLNEEATIEEVKKLIEDLSIAYLSVSENEYKERTLELIKYNVELQFEEFNEGAALKKKFRKDIIRHYTIECTNCLKKISTKTDEDYWIAQNRHNLIEGKKFCSEECLNKYINEIKLLTVKEEKTKYKI